MFIFQIQPVEREVTKVIYTTAGLNLPVSSIDRSISLLVSVITVSGSHPDRFIQLEA